MFSLYLTSSGVYNQPSWCTVVNGGKLDSIWGLQRGQQSLCPYPGHSPAFLALFYIWVCVSPLPPLLPSPSLTWYCSPVGWHWAGWVSALVRQGWQARGLSGACALIRWLHHWKATMFLTGCCTLFEQVVILMNIDLLRQQQRWKDGLQELRTGLASVAAQVSAAAQVRGLCFLTVFENLDTWLSDKCMQSHKHLLVP